MKYTFWQSYIPNYNLVEYNLVEPKWSQNFPYLDYNLVEPKWSQNFPYLMYYHPNTQRNSLRGSISSLFTLIVSYQLVHWTQVAT